MKKLLSASCVLLCASAGAYGDGQYDFSYDADSAGRIWVTEYVAPATYGPLSDFTIDVKQCPDSGSLGGGVDALSGHHRFGFDAMGVDPTIVLRGSYDMLYSVDGASDLHEWRVSGPLPAPLGTGRTLVYKELHESATNLGLVGSDLDALQTHYTYTENGRVDGPRGHWEIQPGMYFSTELGNTDPGDIYARDGAYAPEQVNVYLDDQVLARDVFGDETLDLNVDALVVFDRLTSFESFDMMPESATEYLQWHWSDLVLFSIAPLQDVDEFGDNIYWYSAAKDGTGGLYADPGLHENIDALDVHALVPEPGMPGLAGLALLGTVRRRKKR